MQLKKLEFSNGEILEYLEEMISDGLATEIEERFYQNVKYHGKFKKSDLQKIKANMVKWYNEVF